MSTGGPIDEAGSAIVGVLAVGLIAAVIIASAAVQLSAVAEASRMGLAREQALLLAEYGTAVALERLDAGAGHPVTLADAPARVMSGRVDVDRGSVDYVVDLLGAGPSLRITSQGTAGSVTRAVVTDVRRRTTADLLWMVDRDVVDPVLLGTPRSACDHPRQSGLRGAACHDVAYGAAHRFDGPFHSNDALRIDGSAGFASTASSAGLHVDASGRISTLAVGPGALSVATSSPFGLTHAPIVRLPERASDVLEGEPPTCRFRGPTLLRFDGHAVRVTSPLSVPQPDDGAAVEAGIGCVGVDLATLASPTSVVLPASAVIEVVDADGCNEHPLGIGVLEDRDRLWRCDAGDAFVWGRYLGSRTVLAEGSVMLLWDLEPGTASAAIDPNVSDATLGLVATDSIVLRRLVGPPLAVVAPYGRNLAVAGPGLVPFGAYPADAPTSAASPWSAPRIVASLVALRGGIGIQNPFVGERHPGALHVIGSVAQRFHGIYGWELRDRTGSVVARTGYDLALTYDRRLVASTPPALPANRVGRLRLLRTGEVDPETVDVSMRP